MYGIVVGIDASPEAERALGWAVDEAERRQQNLTVVTVVPTPARVVLGEVNYPHASDEDLAEAQGRASATVEKVLAQRHSPSRVKYAVRADYGNVADVLLRYAADAQHIVVGSRGNGGFRRLLLGSVSNAVAHHSPCPVTIVPADRPRHDAA